jgi:hypothetical protein
MGRVGVAAGHVLAPSRLTSVARTNDPAFSFQATPAATPVGAPAKARSNGPKGGQLTCS